MVIGFLESGAKLDDVGARFVVESAVGEHEVEVSQTLVDVCVQVLLQLLPDCPHVHRLLHNVKVVLKTPKYLRFRWIEAIKISKTHRKVQCLWVDRFVEGPGAGVFPQRPKNCVLHELQLTNVTTLSRFH